MSNDKPQEKNNDIIDNHDDEPDILTINSAASLCNSDAISTNSIVSQQLTDLTSDGMITSLSGTALSNADGTLPSNASIIITSDGIVFPPGKYYCVIFNPVRTRVFFRKLQILQVFSENLLSYTESKDFPINVSYLYKRAVFLYISQ